MRRYPPTPGNPHPPAHRRMLAALGALAVAAAEQPGQCLPSARPPPDAPPRPVRELNALIAEYEGGLAALRHERREAYREARRAGSADVFASGLDLPVVPAADDAGAPPPPAMDQWLTPRAWSEVGERVSALSLLPSPPSRGAHPPGGRAPAPPAFYVVGDALGRLHFYQYPQTPLLAEPYDTKHGAAVTAIGFGRRDQSLLVTAASDGSVHTHNLTLPRVPRAPRAARRKKGEPEAPPPPPPTPTPLAVEFGLVADSPANAAAVTGLQIYRRHRHEMVVVADSAGTIRVLFSNGTEYASADTAVLSNPPPRQASRKRRAAARDGADARADGPENDEGNGSANEPKPPAGVVAIRASSSPKVAQFVAISIGRDVRTPTPLKLNRKKKKKRRKMSKNGREMAV